MCVRCLKEATADLFPKNLRHIRPRWSPVEKQSWWNEHVLIESIQIGDSLLRYATAIPENFIFHIIILPEWGHSFLQYAALIQLFYLHHIAVWFLDLRSQGLSEIIYPHSKYLSVNSFDFYLTDLLYFAQEVVQTFSMKFKYLTPINLLLFNHCAGWFLQSFSSPQSTWSPHISSLDTIFRQVIFVNPIPSNLSLQITTHPSGVIPRLLHRLFAPQLLVSSLLPLLV
jgi:hypothetical protein